MKFTAIAFSAAMVVAGLGGSEAFAQSANCQDITPMLTQRKAIADRISAVAQGKKTIDARLACTNFGALVSNGQTLMKFITANKDWCQIPDSFVDGIKADHGRATSIRARACTAAARQAQMEKQAQEGGGGGGLLGGPGLSGASRLPQGAL